MSGFFLFTAYHAYHYKDGVFEIKVIARYVGLFSFYRKGPYGKERMENIRR